MTTFLAFLEIWSSIWPFLFIGSLVVTIALVAYLRRRYDLLIAAGAVPVDTLSPFERVVVVFTILGAGVVIPGATYYYGLRSRYPSKAQSVRHIVWVDIAIWAIILFAFFYFRDDIARHSLQEAVKVADAQLTEEQDKLMADSLVRHEGSGYAITLPASMKGSGEETHDDVTGNAWTSKEANVYISVSRDQGYVSPIQDGSISLPGTIFSQPDIRGAKKAALTEESSFSDLLELSVHTLQMEVDGNDGIRYQIFARVSVIGDGNPEFIEQVRKWILSLEITGK